jgi:hypothetical protein
MSVINLARTALRSAIAKREAAKARLHHAKELEQRGSELYLARERELVAFDDVDLDIVQLRVEAFKCAATGALLPDLGLPDDLAARRAMRDQAREHVATAKAAHDGLVTDLSQAESAVPSKSLSKLLLRGNGPPRERYRSARGIIRQLHLGMREAAANP